MPTRRAPIFLAFVALAGAGSMASAGPAGAATKPCGLGEPIDDPSGEQVYLTAITHRKNVTCAVARAAAEGITDAKLCKKKTTHHGWTVKNLVPEGLLAKFSKGNKSFRVSSQGAC